MAKNKKYKAQTGIKNRKPFVQGNAGATSAQEDSQVGTPALDTEEGAQLANTFGNAGYQVTPYQDHLDFTRETGNADFNPYFKAFNAAAFMTTDLANQLNEVKNRRWEIEQMKQAMQPRAAFNQNEGGVNNLPVYFQVGGATYKTQAEVDQANRFAQAFVKRKYANNNTVMNLDDVRVASKPGDPVVPFVDPQGNPAKAGPSRPVLQRLPPGVSPDDVLSHDGEYWFNDPHTGDAVFVSPFLASKKGPGVDPLNTTVAMNTKKYQVGGQPGVPPVEMEQGEVFQTTDGQLNKVPESAPTHEGGGFMAQGVSRVLEDTSDKRADKDSRSLKLPAEAVTELTGYTAKSSMTHSKALEHAKKFILKDTKAVEAKIKKNLADLAYNPNDKITQKSLDFNLKILQGQTTEAEVFDNLFNHQEMVKSVMGIENPKAQYGGKYSTAQFGTYNGGRTKAGSTTPTGKNNAFQGTLQDYLDAWKNVFDVSGLKSVEDLQGATYDYLLNHNPEILRAMWQDAGNTAQGLQMGILKGKGKNGNFAGVELSDDDLRQLKAAYVDQKLGYRTLKPGTETTQDYIPPGPDQPTPDTPEQVAQRRKFNFLQPKSRFHEPIRWYDVYNDIQNATEGRIPVQYNGAELHKINTHLFNPLPQLQAGQASYNAALESLPLNGQGYANTANLFAKKYAMDNQVLGQAEQLNGQKLDARDQYNAQVDDRQSLLDQQARAVFEDKYLGSLEAARQQKNVAWDSLKNTLQGNQKLNREGNLVMQLAPAFDQNAQYNGYRVDFRAPLTMSNNSLFPNLSTQPAATGRTRNYNFVYINGKKYTVGSPNQ